MKNSVENKRVLVTGAATGIGRATALRLVEAGAIVALWDRDAAGLAATAEGAGGRTFAVEVDVSNGAAVRDAFARTLDGLGGLDAAFNNAGIGAPTTCVEDIDEAVWDAVQGVNLKGVWLCLREQVRYFKSVGGGVIVNNASVAGLVALPMQGAYAAAKHGVVGLTKVAAVEGAGAGVRVNAICPGAVRTSILAHLEEAGIDEAKLAAMSPQNRIADPREVAQAVLFLLSDASSFITGAAIPVDGGWCAA